MIKATEVQSDEEIVQLNDESAQSSDDQKEQNEVVAQRTNNELTRRLKEVSLEAKTSRQKYSEEKRKREETEKSRLQENGQYKELADVWQRKANDTEAQTVKLKQAFAYKTVSDAIAMEAMKMGCIDVDSLTSLLPLDQVPITDTFDVDKASVRVMLEDFKKNKAYFFSKPAPKIADAVPGKAPGFVEKNIETMTTAEIEKTLLSNFKKKGN